jgi:hypothetical protein
MHLLSIILIVQLNPIQSVGKIQHHITVTCDDLPVPDELGLVLFHQVDLRQTPSIQVFVVTQANKIE